MLKISPLFSGSRGNCTLIQTDRMNILLDAGYHYKQIVARLADFSLALADVAAIVLTHEHSDHISALPYLTRGLQSKVYAPKAICNIVAGRTYCSEVLPIEDSLNLDGVTIDLYQCSHDSTDCVGYRFTCGGESVASVTDTGRIDDLLIDFLSPCKGILLESNHDVDMLNNGPYPYLLKRRILSDYGHLSNDQTAQVIARLKGSNVKHVVLSHLSEQNNTKEIAFSVAVKALNSAGLVEGKDIKIYVADQYANRITIC